MKGTNTAQFTWLSDISVDKKCVYACLVICIVIDIAIGYTVIFHNHPYYNISIALALLMVLFWLLLLKPFTVLYTHQGCDPHNHTRFFYDVIKAHIIFLLIFCAISFLLSGDNYNIVIHYTIEDGIKELITVISLVFSVMLAVITTLFKHVKEDVNTLITEAKKQAAEAKKQSDDNLKEVKEIQTKIETLENAAIEAQKTTDNNLQESKKVHNQVESLEQRTIEAQRKADENLQESKKIHDRIESLEQGQITPKQLSASNEVMFCYLKLLQEYNVTKNEELTLRYSRIEQILDLLKIPPQQTEDFKSRFEVIILNNYALRELDNLPLTRAYLLAIAAWKNTPPDIAAIIGNLNLKAL